jgi:hypothetical protein
MNHRCQRRMTHIFGEDSRTCNRSSSRHRFRCQRPPGASQSNVTSGGKPSFGPPGARRSGHGTGELQGDAELITDLHANRRAVANRRRRSVRSSDGRAWVRLETDEPKRLVTTLGQYGSPRPEEQAAGLVVERRGQPQHVDVIHGIERSGEPEGTPAPCAGRGIRRLWQLAGGDAPEGMRAGALSPRRLDDNSPP